MLIMNVLKTVKTLLTHYPLMHIDYESIKAGEGRQPNYFYFKINDIKYRFYFDYYFPLDDLSSGRHFSDALRLDVENNVGITRFSYTCNKKEKQDIIALMYEIEQEYYHKLISEIAVPSIINKEPCPDMNMNGVEVSCNPDML